MEKILLLSREPEGKLLKEELIHLGFNVELSAKIMCQDSFDVIISYHYPNIIAGDDLLWVQRHINFNIHNTYLPYGRGIYGIMWAAAFRKPQGFTLHDLDTKVDSGAILYQEEVLIEDRDSLRDVWYKIEDLSVSYLLNNIKKIHEIYINRSNNQKNLGFYKSRKDSMKLYELLPNGWDTDIKTVRLVSLEHGFRL